MVGLIETVAAGVALIGLVGGGFGWLARRDNRLEDEVTGELEKTQERVGELDTAFARLTTRLFGHPDDRTDGGLITDRGERVETAEGDIESLSDRVACIADQAEENGETIEQLAEHVSEHAEVTHEALTRIEQSLEGDVDLPGRAEGD